MNHLNLSSCLLAVCFSAVWAQFFSDLAFSNYKFRRGRQEIDDDAIPDLGVQFDSEEDTGIEFPSLDIDPVTEAPGDGDILRAVFSDDDPDEESQTTTTTKTTTTTNFVSVTTTVIPEENVKTGSPTISTTSPVSTASTETVTNDPTTNKIDTRVAPVTTTTQITIQSSTPSSSTTTELTTTVGAETSSAAGPDIVPRLGPGYSADYDGDQAGGGGDVGDGGDGGDGGGPLVSGGTLGPLGLSLCSPLTRAECGAMGDLNIWTDLLNFVEEGNIQTRSLNTFLNTRLADSLASLPASATQVLVFPSDFRAGRLMETKLTPEQGISKRSIGSSCTSHSQTIKGGEISLKMLNDFETLRPARTDSSVIKSAGPDPRSRIPRKRTLEKLVSSSSFMEGNILVDTTLKAEVHMKMFKNLFIACVPTKSMLSSVSGSYASEARLGAQVEGLNYQLDYVNEDTAQLGFDVNIKLMAKLNQLGSRMSCSPSDGLCDLMESMKGMEDMGDTEVTSPALVSRLERVLGVNTGERVKIVIPRSSIQPGTGIDPRSLNAK